MIVLFMVAIALLGMTTFMATETLFMVLIQHACGLFTISSYRLAHAFDDCKNVSVITAKLIRAIRIHERSLQFVKFINSCFAVSYACLTALGMISLVANMLRLLQAIESNIVNEIFASALYVIAHFCYVFWVNYFGQYLSDHSDSIFDNTYNTRWYMAPQHAQTLLFVVLQRSLRTCIFNTFGGLLAASMEGFASLISLSVSYFTMLYSFRT
ncbi:uncharacterized protein LOC109504417 [Harpegnathos saltator]|uniref:uncharacterized protein LOC109504417 n=1 Tax=Harpegnathos saltator TaxID=610380 RepID=UPI000DBEE7C4|nr:uncharacterized protein LOC109504417 [Harpegnathos saltator]